MQNLNSACWKLNFIESELPLLASVLTCRTSAVQNVLVVQSCTVQDATSNCELRREEEKGESQCPPESFCCLFCLPSVFSSEFHRLKNIVMASLGLNEVSLELL